MFDPKLGSWNLMNYYSGKTIKNKTPKLGKLGCLANCIKKMFYYNSGKLYIKIRFPDHLLSCIVSFYVSC